MTMPLFADPAADAEGYGPSRGSTFDALGAAARNKLGVGENWRWYSWEVVDRQDVTNSPLIVWGGVPVGTISKGPRKGDPKWPPQNLCQRTVIYDADIEAAKVEHEQATGKCADCIEGFRPNGWHHEKGHKYKPCERCAGTGVRTIVSVQPSPSEEK